jgi:hypothetical protein
MGTVIKNNRFKRTLPEDAKLIKQYGSWDFYFSKSEYSLFIEGTEYHPRRLKLSENDFFELIDTIESAMKAAKEEILKKKIGNSMASTIENKRNIEIYINKQKLN